MILQDSIRIEAPAESAFNFFNDMADNYVRWHPDHLSFKWLEGNSVKVGSIFYFEEIINGEKQKKAMRFTAVKPGLMLEFTPMNLIVRYFMPSLKFETEPINEHSCCFTATIRIRLSPIGQRLNAKEFDAVRKHMREEGENLKRLLEAETAELSLESARSMS